MYHFLIVPDTQNLAKHHPDIFMNMTKTIVEYKENHPLDAVIHLGDIVDGGGFAKHEFDVASHCFSIIDKAEIPLLLAAGNHDYDSPIGVDIIHPNPKEEGRNLSIYNDYFGINRLKNKEWYVQSYQPELTENSYYAIGSIMVLLLEYGPRNEILQWAQRIVERHPKKKFIIITHSYMYHDGGRTSEHSDHNPIHSPETADGNDGEMIWQKFIKHHANIIAVFSGHHVSKNVSYQVDQTIHHNKIVQSFQNWQEEKYGGAGRMRLVQYDEVRNSLSAKVFNPLTKLFEAGNNYEFSIELG